MAGSECSSVKGAAKAGQEIRGMLRKVSCRMAPKSSQGAKYLDVASLLKR